MKQNRLQNTILVFVFLLLVGAVVIWLSNRPRYDWEYRPAVEASTEPFSTQLFDSVMQQSLPKGYSATTKFDSIATLNLQGKRKDNFIVQDFAETYSEIREEDIDIVEDSKGERRRQYPDSIYSDRLRTLVRLAQNGSHIVVAMRLNEEEGLYTGGRPYSVTAVKHSATIPLSYDSPTLLQNLKKTTRQEASLTLSLYAANGQVEEAKVLFPMAAFYFTDLKHNPRTQQYLLQKLSDDNDAFWNKSLALYNKNYRAVSIVGRYTNFYLNEKQDSVFEKEEAAYDVVFPFRGGGSITLTTLDVAFTNYACVNPEWRKVQKHFIAPLSDRHLVRIEDNRPLYEDVKEQEQAWGDSDLQYFLKNPPLRLALYVFLLMGVLLLLFNTRRRYAVLQPMVRLHNSSLSYITQIALLFGNRKDYREALRLEQQFLLKSLQQHFRTTATMTQPHHYLPLLAKRLQWSDAERAANEQQFRWIEELLLDFGDTVTRKDYLVATKSIHHWVRQLEK